MILHSVALNSTQLLLLHSLLSPRSSLMLRCPLPCPKLSASFTPIILIFIAMDSIWRLNILDHRILELFAMTGNSQQVRLDDLITTFGLKLYETIRKWWKRDLPVWSWTKRNASHSVAGNDFHMISDSWLCRCQKFINMRKFWSLIPAFICGGGREGNIKCRIARRGLLESATLSSFTVIVIGFKSQLNKGRTSRRDQAATETWTWHKVRRNVASQFSSTDLFNGGKPV